MDGYLAIFLALFVQNAGLGPFLDLSGGLRVKQKITDFNRSGATSMHQKPPFSESFEAPVVLSAHHAAENPFLPDTVPS